MKKIHFFFGALLLITLLVFFYGCSNIPQETGPKELVPVHSIGVLPAQPARIYLLPADTKTREQLEAGAKIFDSMLIDYFQGRPDVSLIAEGQLGGLQAAEPGQALSLAREAGRQFGYDAVLVTEVSRYQTRLGSEYVVNTPASVAFSLKLLAIASSQVIWSADFDQTQQPLFDNILSSRSTGSGFRWLTAAELAQAGLTKKLDNCPYLKKH